MAQQRQRFRQLVQMATDRLLGNNSGSTGDIEELTISEALDFLSATQGVVPYRGSSTWAGLAVGTAGQVLTSGGAGANPSWANLPIITKRKTADESVTSSTTLQDDDHLTAAIEAGCNYAFTCYLSLSGTSVYGSKYDFGVPSGASGFFTAALVRHNNSGWVTRQNAIGTGTGTTSFDVGLIILSGWVENPTNAGNFTLKWAQSTSNGTALTIQKTSFMTLTKI